MCVCVHACVCVCVCVNMTCVSVCWFRYHTYKKQTLPILEHFEKQGKVERISGEPLVDEVLDVYLAKFPIQNLSTSGDLLTNLIPSFRKLLLLKLFVVAKHYEIKHTNSFQHM